MLNLSIKKLASIVSGNVHSQVAKAFNHFGTDTRQSLKDDLFIALEGENFDAHDFLDKAVDQGAACLLVHKKAVLTEELLSRVSVVVVDDTLQALQNLASWWREECEFKVVGITGSNGKTTTKEITLTLLNTQFQTHAAKGSFNNHWGVPFTILSAPKETEVLVLEMGMNALGEIGALCKVAKPDVVVCTTVGTAHIGELGSQENIAKAKFEIYEHSPSATKIFNFDNEYTIEMLKKAHDLWPQDQFFLFSSFRKEADVFLRANDSSLQGLLVNGVVGGVIGEAFLNILGRQNVVNVGAACSIAFALGISPDQIWKSLPLVKGEWGRNQLVETKSGAQILFDGYNANPDSMAALIKNMFEIWVEGKKYAVLGEMFELGEHAAVRHKALGEMIANTDIEGVWFVGPSASDFEAGLKAGGFAKTYFISETYEESLASKFASMLQPHDIVVVKGSRAMKLEQVVVALEPLEFDSRL